MKRFHAYKIPAVQRSYRFTFKDLLRGKRCQRKADGQGLANTHRVKR